MTTAVCSPDEGLQGRHPGYIFYFRPRNTLRFTRAALCALLCIALAGCSTTGTPASTLEHVVVVWLKEPGNAAHREKILAESEVLRTVPGVLSLKSGTAVTSERAIVDSSFDVALIVSFADKATMDTYLVHPVHVQLVNETLKPLVEKIQVYDFQ